MPDALTVIRHAERPTVAFADGATYQPIIGDDTGAGMPIRTGIQTSPPGYATLLHSHPYAEVLTVLEGRGEAWLDGEKGVVTLEPRGDDLRAAGPGARLSGCRRPAARDPRDPHPRQAHRQLRVAAEEHGLSSARPTFLFLSERETTRWPSAVSI
jgi:hypothetical protein